MKNHALQEKGQGLVEYSLILILVAIVVMAILTVLGPQVGDVYSRIVVALSFGNGPITGVTAARTGDGNGNDVVVTVTVSEDTTVTIKDSQSGQTLSLSCTGGSCQGTLAGVGHNAGTVTTTAGGGSMTTGYGAQSS